MEITSLLTKLGLSNHESLVYLTLLEHGNLTVSKIAQESQLHRPGIYKALPQLEERGLINKRIVGKRTLYNAESPERIRSLLEAVHIDLDNMITKLNRLSNKHSPVVKRLDGKAGVHAVYEDVANTVKKGEEFYRYNAAKYSDLTKIGEPEIYQEKRAAGELERLVISNPDYVKHHTKNLEDTLKVVPENFFPFDYNAAQIIYGDKVAFIDYNQPIATIIENPILARFQKNIFKMLFRQL